MTIQFPYRVKIGGRYFDPHTDIEVPNVAEYIAHGAKLIDSPVEPTHASGASDGKAPPRRGRKPKQA